MTDSGLTSRYTGTRGGWIALAMIAIFVIAVLQAGPIQEAFKSVTKLRVILPQSGLSGLSPDSEVEVLGTTAGRVVRIVVEPDQPFYAEVEIESRMKPFVRRDSRAFIRKQFGIAGVAYLEITRGFGEPLDWDFAVIDVETEIGAADSVDQLIGEVRGRIQPILDDTQRALTALADLAERIGSPGGDLDRIVGDLGAVSGRLARGEGTLGRLVTDDTFARDMERAAASLSANMDNVSGILDDVKRTSSNLAKISGDVGGDGQQLANLTRNANRALAALNRVLEDFDTTLPALAELVDNSARATATLPTFLTQTQKTLAELEALLRQLQGNWLFQGDGSTPQRLEPMSPLDIRP